MTRAAFRRSRELDGVVEEVGNSLEQQITITPDFDYRLDPQLQGDSLLVGEGLVQVNGFTHDIGEIHLSERRTPLTVIDFRYSQNGADRAQKLVNILD